MKKFIVFAFSVASTLLSAQSVTGQLTFIDRLGASALNYPQGDTLRAKVVDDQYDVSSLGFVNYGQNQPSFIFDEIPDTIYYGGDSVLIQTQNGKVGNWSNGVTNSDPD